MQTSLQLFRSFLLIGFGAYGGGLVTIPLIQREIVVNQQWLTFDQMASLLAVAQMTPGPIAVNAATFVGFQVNGVTGAAIATVAVILPAILILLWLAPFVDHISHNRSVFKIRQGIQLGVLSLILYATWSYGTIAIKGWIDLLIGIAAFAVLVAFEGKLHPIVVILACGVVGLLFF